LVRKPDDCNNDEKNYYKKDGEYHLSSLYPWMCPMAVATTFHGNLILMLKGNYNHDMFRNSQGRLGEPGMCV